MLDLARETLYMVENDFIWNIQARINTFYNTKLPLEVALKIYL